MSWKNRLFKSSKTIRLRWVFWRSRISAGFGKSAGFRPEPKSGTDLQSISIITETDTDFLENFLTVMLSLAAQLVFLRWGPLTRRFLWLDDRVLWWQWKSFWQQQHYKYSKSNFHTQIKTKNNNYILVCMHGELRRRRSYIPHLWFNFL